MLHTSPKVSIFVLCLGHDCLLIGSRVFAAGLGSEVCPLCSLGAKTSLHAFRDCSDTTETLHLGGFSVSVIASCTTSIFDWLFKTAGSLSGEDFAKFLLILWNLWNRRNLWSHGVGIGVVARDSSGRILGGLAQHSPGLDSPIFVEAAAVRADLQLACE
ncbi:hypothetical protein V6N12_005772 [Hibiscus sabdariffa]|uniref:RNase H type-1 domain-containing protein n=1 Tax=Hibiscus sabdariffa TaxID=183260 RepID=A0ABR2ART5_9ROSI